MTNYGLAQYKENTVSTMTGEEMLILLYDEILKRLNKAKIYLTAGNMEEFEASVWRAREIIRYLSDTLDRRYEVSASLAKLYDFMEYQLARYITNRKPETADEIVPMIAELRDTFKQAGILAKKG